MSDSDALARGGGGDSGNPRAFSVTNRDIFVIAIPMTLAFLSTPLVGLVDTAIIGQLGSAALVGGIAVGAMIFDILFTTFNFLRSGTTGLAAQALGRGDRPERDAVLWRALSVALVSGLVIVVLQGLLLWTALALLSASSEVEAATADYYAIRVLAAPATLANYAILGWFLGLGRAGTGLALQLLLNGINVAVSMYLVLSLNWGIEGAAWGTTIAETATALAGLALAAARQRGAVPARATIFQRRRFMAMMSLNRDIMIRSFALLFAFSFFTAMGAKAGDVVLAANAVLMHFFLVGGYFLDGLATAAEQLAGRAVGARWRPAFDAAVRLTVAWGLGLAAALAAVLWLVGETIVGLMVAAPEVRETAAIYLPWAAATPLFGVLAFQMDGVFIGATWSRDMRNMMLLSLAVYLVAWWLLTPVYGNHGLWAALAIFLLVRGVSLAWRCRIRAGDTFPD